MPKPNHWMPMYWGDLWRDTAHLSAAARGAYYDLIGAYWVRQSPLPDDDDQLMRLARCTEREWRAVKASVVAFFERHDGTLHHKRIDHEISEAQAKYARRASAGHFGGVAKSKQKASNGLAMLGEKCSNAIHNSQPHTPNGVTDAIASVRAREKQPIGTRLGEDWQPSALELDYATDKHNLTGDEIDEIGEQFRRYWTGPDAKNPRKRDWYRTWCNWVDRDAANVIRRRPARSRPGSHGSQSGSVIATFARVAARMENRVSRDGAGVAGGHGEPTSGAETSGSNSDHRGVVGTDNAVRNQHDAGQAATVDEIATGSGSGHGRGGDRANQTADGLPGGRGAAGADDTGGRSNVLAVMGRVAGAAGTAQPDTPQHFDGAKTPRREAAGTDQKADNADAIGRGHGKVQIAAADAGRVADLPADHKTEKTGQGRASDSDGPSPYQTGQTCEPSGKIFNPGGMEIRLEVAS